MRDELTIRVTGEAGQGLATLTTLLPRAFLRAGYHLFAGQDYMSRIRGGNNFLQLCLATRPRLALRRETDLLVVLDRAGLELHRADLAPGGLTVADAKLLAAPSPAAGAYPVPLTELGTVPGTKVQLGNTVAGGVILGLAGVPAAVLESAVADTFAGKDAALIANNLVAARAGYRFALDHPPAAALTLTAGKATGRLVMNGNDAIALGAIRAGCKFYSGYPMSPSTGIMNVMAGYARAFGIVVEQAEDEIAALMMVIGASFAGARAMTATSGGGFALMVEGISLAAMTETPVVVAVVQRPGPATGFPTRTEQADLEFVLRAGHGEFARVVYAPGTLEEAFALTVRAFNVAEQYQIPVIILSDQHLADSLRDLEPFAPDAVTVTRTIISRADSPGVRDYQRYRLTDSGISPRAIPSWIEDVVYADSDEHTEAGHITEDGALRVRMVDKRFSKKMAALAGEIVPPTAYNLESARTVLLGFGSTHGVMREVCADSGGALGCVHLSQVWPFPGRELERLLPPTARVVTVENNAGGQLARLLRGESDRRAEGTILRYDGRPFDVAYLNDQLTARGLR